MLLFYVPRVKPCKRLSLRIAASVLAAVSEKIVIAQLAISPVCFAAYAKVTWVATLAALAEGLEMGELRICFAPLRCSSLP